MSDKLDERIQKYIVSKYFSDYDEMDSFVEEQEWNDKSADQGCKDEYVD